MRLFREVGRPSFWHELLKHDCGIAQFKPAPANHFVSRVVLVTLWYLLALDCESQSMNIEAERGFHVSYSQKRHSLFYMRAHDGCSSQEILNESRIGNLSVFGTMPTLFSLQAGFFIVSDGWPTGSRT